MRPADTLARALKAAERRLARAQATVAWWEARLAQVAGDERWEPLARRHLKAARTRLERARDRAPR